MRAGRISEPAALTTTGIAGVLTAAGVVTFALFPLALPILVLTAAFTAPLVLVCVVAALPVGIAVAVALAVRALVK